MNNTTHTSLILALTLCLPISITAAASSSSASAFDAPTLLTLCSQVLQQHPAELLKGMQDVGYKDTSALTSIVTKVISDQLVATNGKEVGVFRGHEDYLIALQLSPDNTTLYSKSRGGAIYKWNTATQQQIDDHLEDVTNVKTIQLCRYGTTIYGTYYKGTSIRAENIITGELIGIFKKHDDAVLTWQLSPDGTTLYSGSRDQTIRVWNTATYQQIALFKGHQDAVSVLQLSSDNTTLYSGSFDKTIRAWRVNYQADLKKLSSEQLVRLLHVITGRVAISTVYTDELDTSIIAALPATEALLQPPRSSWPSCPTQ